MFGDRRYFNDLLSHSEEGIASNILSNRLRRLVENGLLSKAQDPNHRQRQIYALTERSIALVPVLATLGEWGTDHLPVTPELSVRARILADGGPELWRDFMDELGEHHLGITRAPGAPSVAAYLSNAYQEMTSRGS